MFSAEIEEIEKDEGEKEKENEIVGERKEKPASLAEYLEKTYGVRVKRITFEEVEPPSDYSAAATARAKAEQDALRAEQEKKRIETLAAAEAERVKKSYDAVIGRGEAGLAIRALESLDKAGEGKGNYIITAGPGLVDGLTKLAAGVKVEKGSGA